MICRFKGAKYARRALAGLFLCASSLVIAHAQQLTVESDTFSDGDTIPTSMVGIIPGICSGDNQSPHLRWTAGPTGTKSYAIVALDITGGGELVHWMVTDIPADVTELSAGQPSDLYTTHTNGFLGIDGYAGMCPTNPQGGAVEHTYTFTVYALQQDLTNSPPTVGEIGAASQGSSGTIGGKKTYSLINPSLTSTEFSNGAVLPDSMLGISPGLCSGANKSPALSWNAWFTGTKYYAIVATDTSTTPHQLHWSVVNIPGTTLQVPENGPVPGDTIKAYEGICPPNDGLNHQYTFTLYTLEQALATNATPAQIQAASKAQVSLSGTKQFTPISPNLASTGFANGDELPDSMLGNSAGVCSGANRSPSLSWNAWFAGTTHYAIVATDTSTTPHRLHWSVVNIPGTTLQVPENGPVPGHIIKAYEGICPPDDGQNHQYTFTLYALNAALGANVTPAQIQAASIAQASLSGTKRFTPRGAGGTAVPTLGTLAILSLSALAGIMGLRYRRKLK